MLEVPSPEGSLLPFLCLAWPAECVEQGALQGSQVLTVFWADEPDCSFQTTKDHREKEAAADGNGRTRKVCRAMQDSPKRGFCHVGSTVPTYFPHLREPPFRGVSCCFRSLNPQTSTDRQLWRRNIQKWCQRDDSTPSVWRSRRRSNCASLQSISRRCVSREKCQLKTNYSSPLRFVSHVKRKCQQTGNGRTSSYGHPRLDAYL